MCIYPQTRHLLGVHPTPIPKTLRSLTSVALKVLANRNDSTERGQKGGKCHQSHTETSKSKRDQRQFLFATSFLAVLSSCLRGLAKSQNSGFVSGLKKPYLAWSLWSERAGRFWRPLHLPVPQEGWVIFLILLVNFSYVKKFKVNASLGQVNLLGRSQKAFCYSLWDSLKASCW